MFTNKLDFQKTFFRSDPKLNDWTHMKLVFKVEELSVLRPI